MKKRLALLWTPLVLVAAMMLPASTAAASGYTYKVIDNYCYGSGGNSVQFKVKETAQGWTPANYETIDSFAQRKVGSNWQRVFTWNQVHYSFPANGQNHWLTLARAYNGNNTYYFRIVFNLRIWHNNQVLASKTVHSFQC